MIDNDNIVLRMDEFKSRIGFRLEGFKREPLIASLEKLANVGYKAIELCLEHPELDPRKSSAISPEKLRNVLNEFGLAPSAVSFHGKRCSYEEKEEICIGGIDLCRELKCGIFITGSSTDMGSFDRMVNFCSRLCDYASRSNIFLAVEPEPGTVIENSTAMAELMKAVNSPKLRVNLDIGHSFLTEADLYSDIIRWGELIVHTHIEDIKIGAHQHLLPGTGDIEWHQVWKALLEIRYKGFFIMDLFNIEEAPILWAQRAYDSLISVRRGDFENG